MSIFEIFTYLTALYYGGLMLTLAWWGKLLLKQNNPQPPDEWPTIDVIVAARNEQMHIADLLYDLRRQHYPSEKFRVIIANDHSTDATQRIALTHALPHWQIVQVPPEISGKKAALRYAAQMADAEILAFTDADCRLPATWLGAIATTYCSTKAHLMIGPVELEGKGLWSTLQAVEFMPLSFTALASARFMSIMANGANLAASRKFFNENAQLKTDALASGDDMFLLEAAKRRGLRIEPLAMREAIVRTAACPDLASFVAQRRRWASKAPAYRDAAILGVGTVVFATNVLWVLNALLALIDSRFVLAWLAVSGLKMITDAMFWWNSANFFQKKHLWAYFLALQWVYPWYAVGIAITGMGKLYWKGRRID